MSQSDNLTPKDGNDITQLREELAAEFSHHLEMIERSEIACGASPDAARTRAIHRFGDQERAARACEQIVTGDGHMATAAKIGVIAMRLGMAAALVFAIGLAWSANKRAIEASNLAGSLAQRSGLDAKVGAGLSINERANILASVWGPTSGEIEVKGAVKSPGKFHTDTTAPLDLAALIERAGGTTSDAKSIIWNQRGEPGDISITLANAQRYKGDFNTMPAPGSIITVK